MINEITLKLNGKVLTLDINPMKRLLDVLREDCGLWGIKEGCGEGECGACSVLIDGVFMNACLYPVGKADGKEIIRTAKIAPNQYIEEVDLKEALPKGSYTGEALVTGYNRETGEEVGKTIVELSITSQ